jgi:hypothetical protein
LLKRCSPAKKTTKNFTSQPGIEPWLPYIRTKGGIQQACCTNNILCYQYPTKAFYNLYTKQQKNFLRLLGIEPCPSYTRGNGVEGGGGGSPIVDKITTTNYSPFSKNLLIFNGGRAVLYTVVDKNYNCKLFILFLKPSYTSFLIYVL